MKTPQIFDYPLFNLGFRAFFALAGLSALGLITLWSSVFNGSVVLDNYYPTTYWHAHEMLLGY
ncbi:MAG: NnrS family protein, partial [Methylococcales bacterium]|nr:NnrS family protein [Methylococcales bacterium]